MDRELFTDKDTEVKFFFILASAITLLVFTSFVLGSKVERGPHSAPTQITKKEFPKISLEAKSVYVYDLRNGEELFAKNENERLPLASLAKIMSAVVASDISPAYGTINVTSEALTTYGDSGLKPGEKWTLRDLLDFSLITSSNDGIKAVAMALGSLNKTVATGQEAATGFVEEMNRKAEELGLSNTYFWNETGLDESEAKAGAYGSAKDVSTLLSYALSHYPDAMEATREIESKFLTLDNRVHLAKNTNVVAGEIPGLLASKTGFTNAAGGNLAFAFDPEIGRPIMVVILGSSTEGRFRDAEKIVSAVMRHISSEPEETQTIGVEK